MFVLVGVIVRTDSRGAWGKEWFWKFVSQVFEDCRELLVGVSSALIPLIPFFFFSVGLLHCMLADILFAYLFQ